MNNHERIINNKTKSRMLRRRGKPVYLRILKKSKHIRRWLLHNPWIRPLSVFNYAAILIQKIVRGFIARRRKYKKGTKDDRTKRKKKGNNPTQLENYMNYLDKFRESRKIKPSWLNGGYSAWCVVKIQSIVRMFLCRRKHLLAKRLVNQVASIIIQTFWRNAIAHVDLPKVVVKPKKKVDTKQQAALKIQLCWRSFCNRRIYKYFRDLVILKLKGAPADLLRSIISGEADILDRAAGVHVRFRLGGAIFPPKIFFKIFTHRPLCDVNAFAPRDYTAERNPDAISANNKSQHLKKRVVKTPGIKVGVKYFETILTTTNPKGIDNWYRREENNHWRPIASHIFETIAAPPWFKETAHISKPTLFHHSRLHRQQDLEKMKRRKKREWMMKMYGFSAKQGTSSTGSLQVSNELKSELQLSQSKDKLRVQTEEKLFLNTIEHDDKDALIRWRLVKYELLLIGNLIKSFIPFFYYSMSLDFDAYSKDWGRLGTSLPSDVGVDTVYYRECK